MWQHTHPPSPHLRRLHQAHDLRKRGVGAHARHPHAQRPARIHRAAHNGVSRPLGHRHCVQDGMEKGKEVSTSRRQLVGGSTNRRLACQHLMENPRSAPSDHQYL